MLETNNEMVDMSVKSNLNETTHSDEGRINEIKQAYEKRIAELEEIVKQMKTTLKNKKQNVEDMDTQEKIDVKKASTTVNKSSNEDVVKVNLQSTTSKVEVKIVGQKKMEVKKIAAPDVTRVAVSDGAGALAPVLATGVGPGTVSAGDP